MASASSNKAAAAAKNKNKQTKFPVARIKKIMQKDEEVGKVAQATPIVISKALELFLGLLVEESSKVTATRGAKKVEAYHLKHAVDTTEILDFLKEIVQAVPDPSAGGTIDLEAEAEANKKRARPRTKRTPGAATAAATGEGGPPVTNSRRKRKKADIIPAVVQDVPPDSVMVDARGNGGGPSEGTDDEDGEGTGGRRIAEDDEDYDEDE
jgi:hypothetical protein